MHFESMFVFLESPFLSPGFATSKAGEEGRNELNELNESFSTRERLSEFLTALWGKRTSPFKVSRWRVAKRPKMPPVVRKRKLRIQPKDAKGCGLRAVHIKICISERNTCVQTPQLKGLLQRDPSRWRSSWNLQPVYCRHVQTTVLKNNDKKHSRECVDQSKDKSFRPFSCKN